MKTTYLTTFGHFSLFLLFIYLFPSCSSSDDSTTSNKATSIVLTAIGSTSVFIGDPITFEVKNNLEENVTANSTYTFNGTAGSNPYTFSTEGIYDVIATNETLISNTIKITVTKKEPGFRSFTKKILIEDYTGTWCPACPSAASAIATVSSTNSNIYGVGYHVANSDPMENPDTVYLRNRYLIQFFPSVFINGTNTKWSYPDIVDINKELTEKAELGLAVSAEMISGKLNIEAKVGFNTPISDNIYIAIYLVEDNVTTSTPQLGSSQGVSYVHKDVLRKIYTSQLGDLIPQSSISTTTDYIKTLSNLTLPSFINNTNELKVIAFVRGMDSPNYDIYNVQEVHVGKSQDFD